MLTLQLLLVGWAVHVAAQTQVRPPPLDVPPVGYVNLLENIRYDRKGDSFAPLNWDLGSRDVPVVCITYKPHDPNDAKERKLLRPFTPDRLQERLFGDPDNPAVQMTMSQYYWDVSHKQWRMSGKVFDWIELPEHCERYEND